MFSFLTYPQMVKGYEPLIRKRGLSAGTKAPSTILSTLHSVSSAELSAKKGNKLKTESLLNLKFCVDIENRKL